jgi:hypothetical protein
MEPRIAGRRSALSVLTGPTTALLLAVTLMVGTGPGASASRAPTGSTARLAPAAAETDPVAGLASNLEYDVDKIFRYVADEIRYEPYAGILRGAAGTLAARAGNSVDKALLLAALLDASGVQYRFARGRLDAATTAELSASLATDVAGARKIALDPLARGVEEIAGTGTPAASASGPLADLYQQQMRSVVAAGKKGLDHAETRLGETVTMLSDALDGAGIHLPAAIDVPLPADELANHTWVQMAYGSTWRDLDPTLPAAEPGVVLTPASATLPQLPDDLRYKVEFDVLVERASGGQLVTDNALTYSGYADQLAGTPVSFGHVTPSGIQNLGITLSNLFGEGWLDYRPTLEVGTRSLIADKSVTFPAGGGDVFGNSASPGAGPVDGEATGEWLEVHVTPPGSEPEVARRTVFDRLPPDMRAAGDLSLSAIAPIELVDVKGTGSNDFPPMLGARTFAIVTGPTSAAPVLASAKDPLGMSALAYHNVRDAMDAAMALDAGARTFVDGPNIVSVTVDVGGNAQARTSRVGLDIWYRSHGILPLTGQAIGAARSELVAGITDQLAERFQVESLAGVSQAPLQTLGVGDVFDAAAKAGVPVRVLQGTVADSLPYGPQATALIEAALASGDVVVVPAKPVTIGNSQHIGWWTIDPKTGVTADAMDDGSGQVVTEEAVLINGERQAYVCYGAMANWASGAIMAAAEMVSTLAESAIFRLFNGGFGGTQCFAV